MDKFAGIPSWKRDLLIRKEASEHQAAQEKAIRESAAQRSGFSIVAKPTKNVQSVQNAVSNLLNVAEERQLNAALTGPHPTKSISTGNFILSPPIIRASCYRDLASFFSRHSVHESLLIIHLQILESNFRHSAQKSPGNGSNASSPTKRITMISPATSEIILLSPVRLPTSPNQTSVSGISFDTLKAQTTSPSATSLRSAQPAWQSLPELGTVPVLALRQPNNISSIDTPVVS